MASPEGLSKRSSDASLVHRRVVRVGAATAWLVAALFLVGGVLSGDHNLMLQAVGPAVAAALMTTQILFRVENGWVALFGSAVILIVAFSVFGGPASIVPTAVALILICAIGTLLLDSHQMPVTGVLAVLLFATPLFWNLSFDDALMLGLVMGLSLIGTAAILLTIKNAASSVDARYETLFDSSPTPVLEEDWSEALAYIRSEYSGRPNRVLAFLLAYPEVVRRAISRTRVVRVNQAAVELLEAGSADEVLGYRDGSKVTDEGLSSFAAALAGMYQGETTFAQEWAARTLRGRQVWLQGKGVDVSTREPATRVLLGLADVTHLKARQDAMAELVKAKDDFIARVSHELRTPLTAVLGLTSEMASMERMTPDERDDLMQLVTGQAVEMSHIVEDLLVASRAEIGTMAIDRRAVDLEVELQAAIEGLGITVEAVPGEIEVVVADPARVRQILRNLLTNAQRYGGSTIRVEAGTCFSKVWLEVRDDGSGVPEHLARSIFEPYGTAHSGVEGSVGLGLSVSRQLAELMGGSLGYRRDGSESVFRLELPLAAGPGSRSLASQMADV